MEDLTTEQILAGIQAQIQAVQDLSTKMNTFISDLLDTQKGQYGTTVRGTHVKQDIHADEAISHNAALLTNLAQFAGMQSINQGLVAGWGAISNMINSFTVTNQQNWNGTGGSKTPNAAE